MRRLFLGCIGLAVLLLVILSLQRAIYERLSNRPFLGVWTQSNAWSVGGAQTRIEFARGGNLWIATFGQNRWRAHWEEGSANQLIISGLDPARPKAKEAFRWFVSRDGLSLVPLPGPGYISPFSHPNSGCTLGNHYTRLREEAWPISERVVGVWVTSFGPTVYRTPNGQIRRLRNARVLLDIRRGGELWMYRDGFPRHHGRWTANSESPGANPSFSFVEEDPDRPGNGAIWSGGMIDPPRMQSHLQLELWGRQQDRGMAPQPRLTDDTLGLLSRVPDGATNRKPFVGVWRTRAGMPGRQLQLDILPGGDLWITELGHPHRHGAWQEMGPWPRLIIRSIEPARRDTETEWLWSHRSAGGGRSREAGGETQRFQIPEGLTLVNAKTGLTEPEDGSMLELERVPPTTLQATREFVRDHRRSDAVRWEN